MTSFIPVFALVHCVISGQVWQDLPKLTRPFGLIRRVMPAGHAIVDGEVIEGKPARNDAAQRHRIHDRRVTGRCDVVEEVAAVISRITQHINALAGAS